MRKKYLIIFGIILTTLIIIGILVLLLGQYNKRKAIIQSKNYPEEFQGLIPGLWQSGNHVYYRFYKDGTGHTWDTNDDINESEASPLQWKISKNHLIITHRLRIRGSVPRTYQIDYIDGDTFKFHDSYSSYTLKRLHK